VRRVGGAVAGHLVADVHHAIVGTRPRTQHGIQRSGITPAGTIGLRIDQGRHLRRLIGDGAEVQEVDAAPDRVRQLAVRNAEIAAQRRRAFFGLGASGKAQDRFAGQAGIAREDFLRAGSGWNRTEGGHRKSGRGDEVFALHG
jgi:hypothetical protein